MATNCYSVSFVTSLIFQFSSTLVAFATVYLFHNNQEYETLYLTPVTTLLLLVIAALAVVVQMVYAGNKKEEMDQTSLPVILKTVYITLGALHVSGGFLLLVLDCLQPFGQTYGSNWSELPLTPYIMLAISSGGSSIAVLFFGMYAIDLYNRRQSGSATNPRKRPLKLDTWSNVVWI